LGGLCYSGRMGDGLSLEAAPGSTGSDDAMVRPASISDACSMGKSLRILELARHRGGEEYFPVSELP
jgi:hypothetical protein